MEDPYGPHIPQTIYRPPTASDRRRYIDDVELEPSIVFETNRCPYPGFSLGDALKSYFIDLKGRDDLMFVNRGPSISIRLQVSSPLLPFSKCRRAYWFMIFPSFHFTIRTFICCGCSGLGISHGVAKSQLGISRPHQVLSHAQNFPRVWRSLFNASSR